MTWADKHRGWGGVGWGGGVGGQGGRGWPAHGLEDLDLVGVDAGPAQALEAVGARHLQLPPPVRRARGRSESE